jgi:hypothetical protein
MALATLGKLLGECSRIEGGQRRFLLLPNECQATGGPFSAIVGRTDFFSGV